MPLMVGVVPFGFICGAVCISAGMPEWAAVAMSMIVVAGASQLAAVQLMADHAPFVVVVLTALVINARFLMYSASIASHFSGLSPVKKCVLSFFLTDQAYAMSVNRFDQADGDRMDKVAFYLGTSIFMVVSFWVATWIGARMGALIPEEWGLDFAVPLTFTALVIPAVKDRPALLAALTAGCVSLVASPIPYNLGLLVAALSGIVTGYVAERRLAHD